MPSYALCLASMENTQNLIDDRNQETRWNIRLLVEILSQVSPGWYVIPDRVLTQMCLELLRAEAMEVHDSLNRV